MTSSGDERTLARDTGAISVLTLVSRLTGLVRITVVSAVLGATVLGDVYQGTNMVPTLLFELIAGGAIQAVMVPTFVRAIEKGHEQAMSSFAAVMGILVAITAAMAAILTALSPLIARALSLGAANGYEDRVRVATLFLAVFAPQLIFYAVGAVASAQLQARRMFKPAAFAPVLNNVVVIAVYLVFGALVDGAPSLDAANWKLLLLASGTTFAVAVFTLVPVVFVRRHVPLKMKFNWENETVKGLRTVSGWTFVQIFASVVPSIAAILVGASQDGSVAIFSYAYAIFLLPFALIAGPVATALLPRLALHSHHKEDAEAARVFNAAIRPSFMALMFAAVSLMTLGGAIARLLGFGQIIDQGLTDYATTIRILGAAIIGYGIWFIGVRAMFAYEEIRKAALVTVAGSALSVLVMCVGVLGFDDVNVAHVIAIGLVVGYSAAGALAFWFRPGPLKSIPPLAHLSGFASVLAGFGIYALCSIAIVTYWGCDTRSEAFAVLVVAALVAVPTALAVGVLVWRPRSDAAVVKEVVMLVGPSDGGIRRHALSLASAVSAKGLDAELWAPYDVVEFVARQAPNMDSRLMPVPTGFSPRAWLSARALLRRAIDSESTEGLVVHAHGLKPGLLALTAGLQPVVTWHNRVTRATHGRASGALRMLERWLLVRAKHIFATTEEMVRILHSWGIEPERITLNRPAHEIPIPIRSVDEIKNLTGVGVGRLVVCVARLHRQKGVDVLLEALALAKTETGLKDVRVAIVGDGPERGALHALAEKLGVEVFWVGADDDAVSFIRAADLVVIPSRWESGPLVALEALSFSRPIVASNTGFMNSFASEPDVRLVEPGDIAGLAGQIVSALGDGRRNAARELDDAHFVESVNTVYGVYRALHQPGSRRLPNRSQRGVVLAATLIVGLTGFLVAKPQSSPLPYTGRNESVILVSIPSLEWEDVETLGMRSIAGMEFNASLSIRTIGPRTSLRESYVTIGSGNRASIRDSDIPILLPPLNGCSSALHDAAQADADAKLYEADPGALGAALSRAGVQRRVYGSASAVLALMDNSGCVDEYEVTVPSVEELAESVTSNNQVVLVELGELSMAWQDANPDSTPGGPIIPSPSVLSDRATRIDMWLKTLFSAVSDDVEIYVLGSTSHPGRAELTVFTASIPDVRGVAQSGTTRRAGYVTLPDLAPTVLDHFGLDVPESMNGTPISVKDGAPLTPQKLTKVSEKTTARDLAVGPVSVLFVVLQILLYLSAVALVATRKRIDSSWMRIGTYLIPILPLVVFLSALTPLYEMGTLGIVLAVYAVSIASAALLAIRKENSMLRIAIGVIAANWVLQVIDIVLGGRLQINTVFGYSATVAGRFQGFGNLAFALMAASGLVVAAIPVLTGRSCLGFAQRQWILLIGIITLVADGFPWFGADVGGVLAIVPAFGILWLLAGGKVLNFRRLVGVGAVGIGALGVLALFDLTRPKESQTHLGRFVRKLFDGDAGTIIRRKISANSHMLTSSVWTWLVPIVAIFFVVLVFRAKGVLLRARNQISGFDPLVISAAVLAIIGFAVNDSGVVIPSMMFGVLIPLTIAALADVESGRSV